MENMCIKASSLGRGRGYGGKNKDIRRPGQAPDSEVPSPPALLPAAPLAPQQQHAPKIVGGNTQQQFQQKPASMSHYGSQNVHILNKPNDSGSQTNSRKVSQEERNFCGTGSLSDENSQSVLYIDERYAYLIKQVSMLSSKDDGILTNQKLQHIDSVLVKQCTQPQMLRQALDAISSAAILDSGMSARISLLCCSVWFSRSLVLGQRLHHLFIESMTDKIDGLEIFLDGADQYLVNAATLLADIYTETKMLSPEELVTLARLIVKVSIELLECNTQLALRTLNVQLMQHGKKLYQCVPDKLETLSIGVRKLLISRQPPAPACRIWLLLLSDQCLYRLEPLPKYLQDFYAGHLDDSAQETDQPKDRQYLPVKSRDTAKPDMNKSGDLRSRENRPHKSDSSDRWSVHSNGDKALDNDYSKYKDDVFEERAPLDSSYDSSGVSDSNISDNTEYSNVNGSSNFFNSERKPRPILGAGSRMVQSTKGKSDFEFNEPPPAIVGLNGGEDLIPVFCPSVPPPNFVPRVKQTTSAAQDTADFWNKPPPTINSAPKAEGQAVKPSSGLAGRLDLNSWRQQANGAGNEDDSFSTNTPSYHHSDQNELFENQTTYYSGNEKKDYFDDSKDVFNSSQYSGNNIMNKMKSPSGYGNQDFEPGELEWKKGRNEDQANAIYEKDATEDPKEYEKHRSRNNESREKRSMNARMSNNYEPQEYKSRNNEENNYDLPDESFKKLQLETGTLMWNKSIPEPGDCDKSDSGFDRNGRRMSAGRQKSDRRSSDTRHRERKDDEKDSNWRRRDSDESKNVKVESKEEKWSNKGVSKDGVDWSERENVQERKGNTGTRREPRAGSGRTKPRDTMESSRSASYWTHDDRCDRDYDG